MTVFILRSLCRLLILVLFASQMAQAQDPKLELHRSGVNAIDSSGWQRAVSTKGAFSILIPIPFNDFTIPDKDGATHWIGGKTTEGIKFSVVETPVTAKTPADLRTIPKTFTSNPANKVSDINHQSKGGVETLNYSVSGAASNMHARVIRVKRTLYMMSIEFPAAHKETVAAVKDKFFDSFKLKTQP